MSGVTVVNNWN